MMSRNQRRQQAILHELQWLTALRRQQLERRRRQTSMPDVLAFGEVLDIERELASVPNAESHLQRVGEVLAREAAR